MMFLGIRLGFICTNKHFDVMGIPRVGGAEKVKLQEAIPPFSLIEDSIQGRRAETLVKTA